MTRGEMITRSVTGWLLESHGIVLPSAFDATLIERIDSAIKAEVEVERAAERRQWAGWMRLAFRAIDAHVPIKRIPDGLDDARRTLELIEQGGAT